MLPGSHRKQNNTLHNSIEEQSPATPEASTIDTTSNIDNLNNGKTHKEGNDIETIAENNGFLGNVIHPKDNTSDIVDFHANISVQNDTHSSDLFPIPTAKMLQTHHAHNKMLSHYNGIVVGCSKEIFQTVCTNNLNAVLQALKELNFILANRAPELSAHYVSHWNLDRSLLKKCLILPVCTYIDLLSTQLSRAIEENQGPEVPSSTGSQDSLCQYQGITDKQTGQMHTLILT